MQGEIRKKYWIQFLRESVFEEGAWQSSLKKKYRPSEILQILSGAGFISSSPLPP